MYSLTIIGGGAIGCGFDSPNDENILTHMHGALVHPKISIESIVEIDDKKREDIRKKWGYGFKLYSCLGDSLDEYKSDIVVIATPTFTHLKLLEEILDSYCPKLIICEKPLVSNLYEFKELELFMEKADTKLITHFPRRFDPSLSKLKNFIENSTSKVNHFYGTFTKGLIHNGSHMIDLVSLLVGNIKNIEPTSKEIINGDIYGQFTVETDVSTGIIVNIKNDTLTLFELTIYTDKAKIEITGEDQKIIINHIEDSSKFKGYRSYSRQEILADTLSKYGYNTLDYAVKLIEDEILYKRIKYKQSIVNKQIFEVQSKFLGEEY